MFAAAAGQKANSTAGYISIAVLINLKGFSFKSLKYSNRTVIVLLLTRLCYTFKVCFQVVRNPGLTLWPMMFKCLGSNMQRKLFASKKFVVPLNCILHEGSSE